MLISCSICKELFFPNSDVCGTQCGHLYHELCLKKWQEVSGSCPQCRTKIKEKPRRIYFVIEDITEGGTELDVETLKEKVDVLGADLAEARKENAQLEESRASLAGKIAEYAEKEVSAAVTVKALKQRVKELNRENQDLKPLRKTNESLKEQLKSMARLDLVLKGTQHEVREMINKTPVTPLAVHQLCVYVEALKNQLKVTEEKYKKENESLLFKCRAAKRKLRELINGGISKKTQTPLKNLRKVDNNIGLESRKSLKRPIPDSSEPASECENMPGCSNSISASQPPAPKKPATLVQKKVINNLDKTAKKDIPSDSSDVEIMIYPGPSKSRLLMSGTAQDSNSIFKKLKSMENESNDVNARTDVRYEVWGGSTRHLSSQSEKTKFSTFPRRK